MLNYDKIDKELEHVTRLILEIEFAIQVEEDPVTRTALRSAMGQLKAARTWLTKVKLGKVADA